MAHSNPKESWLLVCVFSDRDLFKPDRSCAQQLLLDDVETFRQSIFHVQHRDVLLAVHALMQGRRHGGARLQDRRAMLPLLSGDAGACLGKVSPPLDTSLLACRQEHAD